MNRNLIYIIIAGILWGIISLFITALKDMGFDSMQCVAIRVFFSAVLMVSYLFCRDKSLLSIHFKDIGYFIGTGILSVVFFNFCYFEALKLIGGAAVPALLLYTAPIFVMILSAIFFKEKITKQKIIALIMTFAGLILVTGSFSSESQISGFALLLGLGSGFGYALYSIFGKFLIDKYSVETITAYTFVIASVGAIPLSGIFTKIHLLGTASGFLWGLGLAIFSTVLPFLFYTKGLKKIDAGKASILATVEPFVAAIVGVLFFQEEFSTEKIVGMALIFIAIVILNLKLTKKKQFAD